MWLLTPIGFFSVVQKASDVAADTLTVRARVKGDLQALRAQYLPDLGEITESKTNDYRFRAVASRADVIAAMAALVQDLSYSNFKSQVAKVQGAARADLYHDVWSALYRLQAEPGKYKPPVGKTSAPVGPTYHPRLDDSGQRVQIKQPSTPTPLDTWSCPTESACVIPDGLMPAALNGVAFAPWQEAPTDAAGWEALAAQGRIEEPAFDSPAGYKKACGVVIREEDGRIWLVAPSNGYGNYQVTFPKGGMDGRSTQATALVEAFEESGLRVRLVRHLVDVKRSQSYTRYYLAERTGGHPGDMGWESQATLLIPLAELTRWLNSPYDQAIIEALGTTQEPGGNRKDATRQ